VLLSGQIGELDGECYVVWQLVDTESGRSLAAKRSEGEQLTALADAVLEGVLSALAERCGVEETRETQSVTELTTADSKAYEYYVAGAVALDHRELDEAIRLFESAVMLDTTFALAYFDQAKAHKMRLFYGEALACTERAWRWRSRLSMQDRMRLEAWRKQLFYRPVGAINLYRELHERWPDDKKILNELAYQLMFCGWYKDCLEICERGMALFPNESGFFFYYQIVLTILGRTREALHGARNLVARFPENPNYWDELALRFIGAGFTDSAEATYYKGLEREPGFFSSEAGLAALSYYRGDPEAAHNSFASLIRRADFSPNSKYRLYMGMRMPVGSSWMLYESGKHRQLLDQIDEAGRLLPDPVDQFYHQRYRCTYLLLLGRADEVLHWVDTEVAKLATGDGAAADNMQLIGIAHWTALDFRARALAALDSPDAGRTAAAALMKSVEEFGNNARLQALRVSVQIALKERDSEAALGALDQLMDEAVGMGYEHVAYLEMRAAANRLAGRFEDAVAVHEKLLKIYGGHAVSHYQLGLLYEEMARPIDAAREYRRFLEMWAKADEGLPQLVDAQRRLAELAKTKP
jgi:tetratricopeptide (TPR) repeat protein